MRARLVGFGVIEVEGTRYEHDVVIDEGWSASGPLVLGAGNFAFLPATDALHMVLVEGVSWP